MKVFILFFTLFIIIIGSGMYYISQQFKQRYVESNAAIAGSTLKQHPELQSH